MLSEEGNPRLESLWAVAGAMGLQITVESSDPRQTDTPEPLSARRTVIHKHPLGCADTFRFPRVLDVMRGTMFQQSGFAFPQSLSESRYKTRERNPNDKPTSLFVRFTFCL